jgi:hypothetical protein
VIVLVPGVFHLLSKGVFHSAHGTVVEFSGAGTLSHESGRQKDVFISDSVVPLVF